MHFWQVIIFKYRGDLKEIISKNASRDKFFFISVSKEDIEIVIEESVYCIAKMPSGGGSCGG